MPAVIMTTCPKCGAKLVGGDHDAPAFMQYGCRTVGFANGYVICGAPCLERQLTTAEAKLVGMAPLVEAIKEAWENVDAMWEEGGGLCLSKKWLGNMDAAIDAAIKEVRP